MRIEAALPLPQALGDSRRPTPAAADLDFATLLSPAAPASPDGVGRAGTPPPQAFPQLAAAPPPPDMAPPDPLTPTAAAARLSVKPALAAEPPSDVGGGASAHSLAPDAAAVARLLAEPPGAHRDEDRSLRAFGFGVFGIFPPSGAASVTGGLDGAGAEPPCEAPPCDWAPTAPAAVAGPDPAAEALSEAASPQQGSTVTSRSGWEAGTEAPAPAAVPLGDASDPAATTPWRGGWLRSSASEGGPAASGRGPARTLARPPVRPAPVSLTLVEGAAGGSIVAAAAGLGAADESLARARLNAVAAEHGLALDAIQLNGSPGPAPARGGDRHGHRAR